MNRRRVSSSLDRRRVRKRVVRVALDLVRLLDLRADFQANF